MQLLAPEYVRVLVSSIGFCERRAVEAERDDGASLKWYLEISLANAPNGRFSRSRMFACYGILAKKTCTGVKCGSTINIFALFTRLPHRVATPTRWFSICVHII